MCISCNYYAGLDHGEAMFLQQGPEGNLTSDFTFLGGKWGGGANGTAGGTVTWSLAGAGWGNSTGATFFSGTTVSMGSVFGFDFVGALNAAFAAWSNVANIDFVQVADGGGNFGVGTAGQIRIGAGFIDGNSNVLARAFNPGSSATNGDMIFDSGEAGFWNFQSFYLVALHEIGHALGLGHENTATVAVMDPFYNPNLFGTGPGGNGLQQDDIDGIVALYGPRGKFNTFKPWDFNWDLVATGDFNKDGNTDVIWQNPSGVMGGWLIANNQIGGTLQLPFFPGWQSVGTGDFNKDGNTDILWMNADGLVGQWLMGNGTRQATQTIQNMAGWTPIATGDFNKDGIGDIIWMQPNGIMGGWLMNAQGQIGGTLQLPFFPGWSVIGTGDFNKDGNTDILWRNADGLIGEWLMGNGTRQGTMTIQNMTGWTSVGTGDFNGDGTSDILWRNADGLTAAWFMRDGQIHSTKSYGSTAGWTPVTTGDFNGNDVDDVMWQNDVTGLISTWLFNNSGVLI